MVSVFVKHNKTCSRFLIFLDVISSLPRDLSLTYRWKCYSKILRRAQDDNQRIVKMLNDLNPIKKKFLILLIPFFFLFQSLSGQNSQLKEKIEFTTIKIPESNQANMVNRPIQDSLGFLWIPTIDGLFRYDGRNFEKYALKKGDPESSAGLIVEKMMIDSGGTHWVGFHGEGLYRLDLPTGDFDFIEPDSESYPYRILDLVEGPDQRIWITTYDNGIFAYDKTRKTFEHYNEAFLNGKSYPIAQAEEILVDKNGKIWVAAGDIWNNSVDQIEGLLHYLPQSNSFEMLFPENTVPFTPACLYEDANGHIWVGTNTRQLFEFNPQTKQFQEHFFKHKNAPRPTGPSIITSITSDCQGRLWLASRNIGIYVYDPVTKASNLYLPDANDPTKFPNSIVWKLLSDENGNIWVSGGREGAFLVKAEICNPDEIPVKSEFPFSDYQVTAFAEQPDGKLWIGTQENGLFLYDQATKAIKNWKHNPLDSTSISANSIKSLLLGRDGNLWIGYWPEGGSLDRLNKNTSKISSFKVDQDSLPIGQIMDLMEDKEGKIWAATWGKGVLRFDQEAESFTRFTHDSSNQNSLGGNFALSLYQDIKGRIWIGGGGTLLNPYQPIFLDSYENGQFRHYYEPLKLDVFPQVDGITDITGGEDGSIWVSKRGVLARIQPESEIVDIYQVAEGKENYHWFWQLQLDEYGGIWSTGIDGLYRLNPEKAAYHSYSYEEFQLRSNWWQPFFKGNSGQFYMGGQNGISSFDPKNLEEWEVKKLPQIYLVKMVVDGKALPENNRQPSNKPFWEIEQIILGHDQNTFSLQLAAPWFAEDRDFEISYRLTDYDEEWKTLSSNGEISYYKVPPGDYTLEARIEHRWGIAIASDLKIELTILAPWWQRWWAFGLYALGLLGIAFVFYYFQLRQKLAEAEAQRIKELSQVKNRLYANITHEFRTPLTVISGLTQEIQGNDKEKKLILRNSQQLLGLVNQILSLQKLESNQMSLNPKPGDLAQFIGYLTESFQSLADKKHLRLVFYADPRNIPMSFDEEKIQQLATNLIANAIKFTPEYGKIEVGLSVIEEGKKVQLKVRDNGIGIPPENIDHIFDRFYQIESEASKAGEGTGIGLALVKELVKLMDGEIGVESEVNKGTTFTIILPMDSVPETKYSLSNSEAKPEIILPQIATLEDIPIVISNDASQSNTLLIVEDNPDVVFYLQTILANQYQMIIARNGKDGWEKATELVPDIIISDVMMPEMDGFTLCGKLKSDERTNHIPVILLTAKATHEERLSGLKTGADAYLAKPFDKEELLIRLEKLLATRQEMQVKFRQAYKYHRPDFKDAFLQKLQKAVEDHLDDENFGTEELARAVAMSRTQLHRKVKALLDMTTSRFIQQTRLQKARHLIFNTDKTIGEIVFETGFKDQSYFTKLYVAEFGERPSESRG